MKHPLLVLFFPSVFFLFFSGCVEKELSCTQKDVVSLQTQLRLMENSLQEIKSKKDTQMHESLKELSSEQKELFTSLHQDLQMLKNEHNQTQTLLQKSQKIAQTKPIVVYRNKKVISKFEDKLILGEEENVLVEAFGIFMRARIDTGASTSSIDAREIEEFERDGKKWVRFTLIDRRTNTPRVLEKRVLRRANIIQSSQADSYDRRIVVKLKIKIGDFSDFSEFTLTNRDHMDFPLLIGRSFLQDIALVDVSGKDLAPIIKGSKDD